MALRRFSDNPPASSLTGTEIVPGIQGGVDVQMTAQDIADLGGGGTSRNTVTAVTPVSGVATFDLSLGDYFTVAPTANVTSIVFTNLPGAGKGASIFIGITQDSTPRTWVWPASFKWAGGVAGVVSTASGAKDKLAITTLDNCTTWDATLAKAFV